MNRHLFAVVYTGTATLLGWAVTLAYQVGVPFWARAAAVFTTLPALCWWLNRRLRQD
jgi:Na+/pantothenate symporter